MSTTLDHFANAEAFVHADFRKIPSPVAHYQVLMELKISDYILGVPIGERTDKPRLVSDSLTLTLFLTREQAATLAFEVAAAHQAFTDPQEA